MSTLWRALLEGAGWHVGKEAAKDALQAAERALTPDAVAPPPDPKVFAAARKAKEKADALAVKERAEAKKRADEEIDDELRALKKRIKP
jgi:hypothetical protein